MRLSHSHTDLLILGAGAAGLMAATVAASGGRSVRVLEHTHEPGRKILISGGGRCNFTNLRMGPECFLSRNPSFCISALRRFTAQDMVRWVDAHGIPWEERDQGRLFCVRSSREIRDSLVKDARERGVDIVTGIRVQDMRKADHFIVETGIGEFTASSVIVATGGRSIPKIGATDLGLHLARRFGLPLVDDGPALTPLMWRRADLRSFHPLAGISLPVRLRCGAVEFEDALLFTHHGVSGPAALQISSYWEPGQPLIADLLPSHPFEDGKASPSSRKTVLGAVRERLPQRLAEAILPSELHAKVLAQCSVKDRDLIRSRLHAWTFAPEGKAGYEKAEVMRGGVDTTVLSSKTMEVTHIPGLYFVGEVVDVTGWLGGYNFQWAWSSGVAAGQAAGLTSR